MKGTFLPAHVLRAGQPGSRAGNLEESLISLFRSLLIIQLQLLISCAPVEAGQHVSRALSSQFSLFRRAEQIRKGSSVKCLFLHHSTCCGPLLAHAHSRPRPSPLHPPVALYAISAVYFAGVMVRLMLTLTPVVCMLSAVAFSSVFEHYMGDDTKREKPPAEDSSDEDDKRNSGNLYDKVRA